MKLLVTYVFGLAFGFSIFDRVVPSTFRDVIKDNSVHRH